MIGRLMCWLGYHDWVFDYEAWGDCWRCWRTVCDIESESSMVDYPGRNRK